MLVYPPISIEGREEDEAQLTPLKADAIMCEMTACDRPARFLLKYKSGVLRADCEKHANVIARRNSEHSPDAVTSTAAKAPAPGAGAVGAYTVKKQSTAHPKWR